MDERLDLTLTLDWESESPAGPVRHHDAYFAAAADKAATSIRRPKR